MPIGHAPRTISFPQFSPTTTPNTRPDPGEALPRTQGLTPAKPSQPFKLREDNSRAIDNEADFRAYFTPKNPEQPEIHGGFAYCHFADERDLESLLKELKVTVRCIPQADNEEPGTCFLTGKPAKKRAIFAKAY